MRWTGKVVGGLVGAAFGLPGALVGAIVPTGSTAAEAGGTARTKPPEEIG